MKNRGTLFLFLMAILQFSFSADETKVSLDYSDKEISRTEKRTLKEFSDKEIKVTPDFTQEEIEQAAKKALKLYGKRCEIEILKRNSKGEIEHLICTRYDAQGKRLGSCEAKSFGYLLIRSDGCEVSVRGIVK